MRAHGFYMKAGLCQYSHFIRRETLARGGSRSCRAGIEAQPSVSRTKALPSSSPTCPPVCTQVAPTFIFHLELLKALFPLPKHFPASHIHCDCFSLCFSVCSYTDWNPICWRQLAYCHGWGEDFILCPKAFPAGQPGFLFIPLQAVSHSLAESVPTRVILESSEICPEGNSRNTGWRTTDHCKLMCFLPLTPTLRIDLQGFIQPLCGCNCMFPSTHVRTPNP